MQASYLSSSLLPPGTIVAWRVTTGTMIRSALAKADPRPLTADQQAHVQNAPHAEPGVPEIAPWLGFSCELPGATRESVAAMLATHFDRHESLRCIFRAHGPRRSSASRHIVEAGGVKFEPVVLGTPESPAQAYDIVAEYLAAEARCNTWPYTGIVTIEHAEGTMIVAAFDHITSDGYSVMLTVDEFQRFHSPEGLHPDENVGSHITYARHESAIISELSHQDAPVDVWRRALHDDGTLPGAPVEADLDISRHAPHHLEQFAIGNPAESAKFVAYCRENRIPVGLGFTALLSHSILEIQESPHFDFLMSTHNRMLSQWQRSVGWFASVAPLRISRSGDGSLLDTMRFTADAWPGTEHAGIVRLPLVNQLFDARIEPGVVVSYLDGKRIPGSERWAATKSHLLIGPVAPSNQIHLWINLMPEGLFLEARYPVLPQTTDWMHRVAAGMTRNLRTASDFAGANA